MGNLGCLILLVCLFLLAHVTHADGSDNKSSLESSLKYQTLHLDASTTTAPTEFRSSTSSTRRTGFIGESKFIDDEGKSGMVASLWHRYSANSPFLPENTTRLSLLKATLLRDEQRMAMFHGRIELASLDLKLSDLTVPQNDLEAESKSRPTSFKSSDAAAASDLVSPVVSGLALGSGEYFTRIRVGTPGLSTYLVMDTGSDILWLQCAPCRNCYSQHDPLFNPKNSTSFNSIPCSSGWCKSLDIGGCYKDKCLYQVSYGDGSFTVGDLAVETFTLGSAKGGSQVIKCPFGCGHDNEGLFVGAAGVLGLGKGSLAFPNQVGSSYSKKFSYCLVSRDMGDANPSSLIFGDAAVPSSSKVKFTPQVYNQKVRTFYYVGLTGVSVGESLLSIPTATFDLEMATGKGGVIIDSGTSITWLKESGYVVVRNAFRAATAHLPRSSSPLRVFDTCFDLSNYTSVDVPTLTMHFQGGANLDLPANNYVIPVDDSGTYCLALAPSASNFSIIGNVQQQNFRIVYDNEDYKIGFVAEQCG